MPFSAVSFEWRFVDVAASRELLASDARAYLDVDAAGAVNITVPDPADVAFAKGTQISIEQLGAGVVTLIPGANVTINSRGALLATNGQFAVVGLVLKSTGAAAVWTAFGDLA